MLGGLWVVGYSVATLRSDYCRLHGEEPRATQQTDYTVQRISFPSPLPPPGTRLGRKGTRLGPKVVFLFARAVFLLAKKLEYL
jgi:hypothetical protein